VVRQHPGLVRESGFAATVEEHEIGPAAVAAPIRSSGGGVVAAVAVPGPAFRVNVDTIPGLAGHVLAAADEISQRDGDPERG
jgi:IclR family transcriptional regulator, acetate operon repressor